jgi:lipid A 4'-phosphatase
MIATRSAQPWHIAVFVAALVGCTIPFVMAPDIDFRMSWWLTDGGRFIPAKGIVWLVYVGLRPFVYTLLAGIAVLSLISVVRRRRLFGIDGRIGAFLLLSMALGPGLVVDLGLKGHWDRARPRDLIEFGGSALYTAPFQPADQCSDNCSFVSGHAAMTFWFVAFGFVAPPRHRALILALAVGAGGLVGLMRIAQGAHFLSDVVYAGFIVVGITWALAAALLQRSGRGG